MARTPAIRPFGDQGRDRPLRVRAEDLEDLTVVAAYLQDAIVPVSEMSFLADENRFVLVAGRFRWEIAPDGTVAEGQDTPFERVHTGIRFEGVRKVRTRGIDRRDPGQMLNLLSLAYGEGVVDLVFAGESTIRLDVDSLSCHVEDLGTPWPTVFRPSHDEGEHSDGAA
ncbi:DUF2948 family protein [Thalassobaculum sp. OXR-137]|uniref:DUF2948 family protein n=1 Tax=Thalassobaculum sp. OXR-137 TaxID=3100173 RepID=UPI002AC8E584|nr:DUF2948 family protein [Thalassobaculum sp. OXR-137]WPZ34507.1 DUF2948 family protein [Thalassobaculum sp. OXR-137]